MDRNAFGGGRILVVEDDVLIAADLVDTLLSMGADVVGPIVSIDKAMERLDKLDGYVGAVLDVNVQGRMVFPLADRLIEEGIPFVFATGYDGSAVPERYSQINRFTKPASDQDIAATLLKAVRSG